MSSPALGLLFGFINTAALHVAKGMQRQGINTLRWRKLKADDRSGRNAAIYILGVILNNSSPVWLILANRFAAPAYATGMFGVGLVLLLMYSSFVLKETVAPVNYAGAIAVILGSALFAVHSIRSGSLDVSMMDRDAVSVFVIVYLAVTGLGILAGFRSRNGLVIGLTFALFAGGAGCLDPILKAVGQNAGGAASLFPTTGSGWIPFGLSFALGASAFIVVQVAFLRGAQASVFVPLQTSIYILLPVVVQLVALPGYIATPALVAGIVSIVAGIVLMQLGRDVSVVSPAPTEGTA